MALLEALGLELSGVAWIDRGEVARRRIERLRRSRRFTPTTKRVAPRSAAAHPRIIAPVAPLGHCSILFAAPDGGLFMANIASQKKRIARSERERQENLRFRSSVKTHFRRLEAAVQSGDSNAIAAEHQALISRIDKAVQRGALHRNTGARKKSRAAGIAGDAAQSQGQS
jgi:small subunit ribosomal protein S20